MTADASDLTGAARTAADELERRLRPYVPDSLRLRFAERFIADLIGERWRHVPPPVDWRQQGTPQDPDVGHRGAAAARAALAATTGEQPAITDQGEPEC